MMSCLLSCSIFLGSNFTFSFLYSSHAIPSFHAHKSMLPGNEDQVQLELPTLNKTFINTSCLSGVRYKNYICIYHTFKVNIPVYASMMGEPSSKLSQSLSSADDSDKSSPVSFSSIAAMDSRGEELLSSPASP